MATGGGLAVGPPLLLQLQRHAGNRAVAQLVGPKPSVQRYESYEHKYLGDEGLLAVREFIGTDEGRRWAAQLGYDPEVLGNQIDADPMARGGRIRVREGLDLTPGEIVALAGDFYGSTEALIGSRGPKRGAGNAAPQPGEAEQILTEMRREPRVDAETRGPGSRTSVYDEVTGGRYLELAQRNVTHFAGANRAEWLSVHNRALTLAREAGAQRSRSGSGGGGSTGGGGRSGSGSQATGAVAGSGGGAAGDTAEAEQKFQLALTTDAFAGHFLTDAYAAGHLFRKPDVEAAILAHITTHPVRAERHPVMQNMIGGLQMARPQLLGQLVLKNIHDRLNREGFRVTNPKGMTWRTYGDDHLRTAAETRHLAALAVFLSRQQVMRARNGETPDPAEITDLMPDDGTVERATNAALGMIPQAATEVDDLMIRNRDILPGIAAGYIDYMTQRPTMPETPGREGGDWRHGVQGGLGVSFQFIRDPAAPEHGRIPRVQRAIVPEDLETEMRGTHFTLSADFASSAGQLAAGETVEIAVWDNASETAVCRQLPPHPPAVQFAVPKKLLRPVGSGIAEIAPYGVGLGKVTADFERGEQKLAAENARKGGARPDEMKRLATLQKSRLVLLNKRLIQGSFVNRFDASIKQWVDHYNAKFGFTGAKALDPNLVKAMLFQETQMGTSGKHLEDLADPDPKIKTRQNILQNIDSGAEALLEMIPEEDPALATRHKLSEIRKDALQAKDTEEFLWSDPRFTAAVTEFFTAVPAGTTDRNFDYDFWIKSGIRWLFHKRRSKKVTSWEEAARAYNGGGARARRYKREVVDRASKARQAQAAGTEFTPPRL